MRRSRSRDPQASAGLLQRRGIVELRQLALRNAGMIAGAQLRRADAAALQLGQHVIE